MQKSTPKHTQYPYIRKITWIKFIKFQIWVFDATYLTSSTIRKQKFREIQIWNNRSETKIWESFRYETKKWDICSDLKLERGRRREAFGDPVVLQLERWRGRDQHWCALLLQWLLGCSSEWVLTYLVFWNHILTCLCVGC